MARLWTDEQVTREKGRLRRTAFLGAAAYLIPPIVAAALQLHSPREFPGFHVAIPIVLICLLPVAYALMSLFDSVLVLGTPRPTTARAALLARCTLTGMIGVLALYLFFHSPDLRWPAVYWALGLPAAVGILRRIPAYQRAMERIAVGAE
jgi:hypothetical protein